MTRDEPEAVREKFRAWCESRPKKTLTKAERLFLSGLGPREWYTPEFLDRIFGKANP